MKFAVIEGLDGSGKSTQLKMLREYLEKNNINYEYLHFPRTDSRVFGELVARFLRGELGPNDQVNPYLVALIYAGDRKDAAPLIQKWIDNNTLVIVDRYVFSNIAYQCAKVEGQDEKQKLKDWILNLEYTYYQIPKPSVNIFFDVPFDFTLKNLTNNRSGDDRGYLQGATDIHEADTNFQKRVREIYLWIAQTEPSLQLISCHNNSGMMPPEEIFEQLIVRLKNSGLI